MRVNRSVPPCTIVPVLTYPDPSKAAEWLVAAFGFSVRLRIANHRVQMKFGEGCLTLAGSDAAPSPTQTVAHVESESWGGVSVDR